MSNVLYPNYDVAVDRAPNAVLVDKSRIWVEALNIVLMMINRILRSLYGKTKKKLEEMKIKDNDDLNMMMRYDDAGK